MSLKGSPQYALNRITWAIDPFSENGLLQRKTIEVLKAITKHQSVAIEPVYIHSPEILNLPFEMGRRDPERMRQTAEIKLADFLKTIKLRGLLKPTFLIQYHVSVTHAVKKLLSQAIETESNLIVVTTTSKQGFDRMKIGSFAEDLLLQSEIPTLIVGPRSRHQDRIKTILFPTDFTQVSREAFGRVVTFAYYVKARITLFHEIPMIHSYGSPLSQRRALMTDNVSQAREKANLWAKSARECGVSVEVIIDEASNDVANGVLAIAKKKSFDMIAMASQTGPVVSALLGSVTINIVRQAPCPVWTIHPAKTSHEKQKTVAA